MLDRLFRSSIEQTPPVPAAAAAAKDLHLQPQVMLLPDTHIFDQQTTIDLAV